MQVRELPNPIFENSIAGLGHLAWKGMQGLLSAFLFTAGKVASLALGILKTIGRWTGLYNDGRGESLVKFIGRVVCSFRSQRSGMAFGFILGVVTTLFAVIAWNTFWINKFNEDDEFLL